MAENKTEKKAVAKKAPVKKTTTKTVAKTVTKTPASKAAAKKPVAKTTTSKAKTTAKAPAKKVTEKVAEKAVVKKEAGNTTSKSSAAPVKTTAKDKQTTKKSGGFLSGLALLCSLVALGLSGYVSYLLYMAGQNYQSKNDSVQTAISEVAEMNERLSFSDSVIEDLKKQIIELKDQQQQMIDVEAVEALVSEQVTKRLEASPASVSPAEQNLESNDKALSLTTEVKKGNVQKSDDKEKITADNVVDSADSGEVGSESTDNRLWSWERTKADIKEMFSGVITITKSDK